MIRETSSSYSLYLVTAGMENGLKSRETLIRKLRKSTSSSRKSTTRRTRNTTAKAQAKVVVRARRSAKLKFRCSKRKIRTVRARAPIRLS